MYLIPLLGFDLVTPVDKDELESIPVIYLPFYVYHVVTTFCMLVFIELAIHYLHTHGAL